MRDLPIYLDHVFLLLDGSSDMTQSSHETKSGIPKCKAIGRAVQSSIDSLHDAPDTLGTLLTVICFDGNRVDDIRLYEYDVYSDLYYQNQDLSLWDTAIGHGGTTPIGRALAYGRELAEKWVSMAIGDEYRRAFIFMVSDGMLYPPSEYDGLDEKSKILKFNYRLKEKGNIRLFTIGYYPEGQNPVEGAGRRLLRSLVVIPEHYIEIKTADEMALLIYKFLTRTYSSLYW